MTKLSSRSWTGIYVGLVALLFILTALVAHFFDRYSFSPVTAESVTSLLTPLFVIALFLERALEVFVSAWRDIGRVPLEVTRDAAKKQAVADNNEPNREASKTAEDNLASYKANTRRISFLAGLGSGVVIAAVGVRVLRPLTDLDAEVIGFQGLAFNFVDIVLTGALLGGGAEGIHKLLSVITDFLDFTRSRIQASGGQQAGGDAPSS